MKRETIEVGHRIIQHIAVLTNEMNMLKKKKGVRIDLVDTDYDIGNGYVFLEININGFLHEKLIDFIIDEYEIEINRLELELTNLK